MPTIIMTIKRRHLRNMESGIKRYELRKTVPRVKDGDKCLVLLNGKRRLTVEDYLSFCRAISVSPTKFLPTTA